MGVTYRIFFVTTTITSSCTKAFITNVMNIAVEREMCQPDIDDT